MNNIQTNSKKIIIGLLAAYITFILIFFILGPLTNNRTMVWINFILDIVICMVSLALNIVLFLPKYKSSLLGKITLLLVTLCFAAFTCFVFLIPESGMPPLLFYY